MRYRSIIALFLFLSWLCSSVPAADTISVTREAKFFFTAAGPNSGGTFVSDTNGFTAWTNPSNAASSNDVYATVTLAASGTSNTLLVSNFGFSVPASATINGLLLEVERKASSTGVINNSIFLSPNGGSDKFGDNSAVSTTESYVSFGGSADLWSGTWSPADINASSFTAGISFFNTAGANRTVSIDHVRMTVTYTAPATSGGFFQLIGINTDPIDRPRSIRVFGEK